MGSFLDHLTLVHHHDPVGRLHRGQAVGDDQGGAAAHGAGERVLHQTLILGVEGARRLVQQQDGGVSYQGAGDGQTLALTAGKGAPAFAYPLVEALGQSLDETARLGGVGRFGDLVQGRVLAAETDIVYGAAGEQGRVLGDQGEPRAHLARIGVADIDPVNSDKAAGRIIEAQQQAKHGALAGARRSHQRHGLAGPDGQGKALQSRKIRPAGIGEGHIGEAD